MPQCARLSAVSLIPRPQIYKPRKAQAGARLRDSLGTSVP